MYQWRNLDNLRVPTIYGIRYVTFYGTYYGSVLQSITKYVPPVLMVVSSLAAHFVDAFLYIEMKLALRRVADQLQWELALVYMLTRMLPIQP